MGDVISAPLPDRSDPDLVSAEEVEDAPSWYAEAQLADLEVWDEQDPDLYRAMAAPRPVGNTVEAEVEIVEDDEYVYDGTALDSVVDSLVGLDDTSVSLDDFPDLDALESLDPFDLTPSFLEEAGLEPEPERPPARPEPVAMQDAPAEPALPTLDELAPCHLRMVPTYQVQCEVSGGVPCSDEVWSRPARIARRLWQRDMDRLAS